MSSLPRSTTIAWLRSIALAHAVVALVPLAVSSASSANFPPGLRANV